MEEMFRSFYFSLPKSFTCPQKSLKVGQSDNADRPRFDNGSDELSTPSSTPRTTGVVASQTRPDGPRTDLCRRPCRVISGPFPFNTHQRPCRDTRRDVTTSLFERVVEEGDDGRRRL